MSGPPPLDCFVSKYGLSMQDCGGEGNCGPRSVIADAQACAHTLRLRAVELMRAYPEKYRPLFECSVPDFYWEDYLTKMATDCEFVEGHPMLQAMADASEQRVLLITTSGENYIYEDETERPTRIIVLDIDARYYQCAVNEAPWSYKGAEASHINEILREEKANEFRKVVSSAHRPIGYSSTTGEEVGPCLVFPTPVDAGCGGSRGPFAGEVEPEIDVAEALRTLVDFGFKQDLAIFALEQANGRVHQAVEWILANDPQSALDGGGGGGDDDGGGCKEFAMEVAESPYDDPGGIESCFNGAGCRFDDSIPEDIADEDKSPLKPTKASPELCPCCGKTRVLSGRINQAALAVCVAAEREMIAELARAGVIIEDGGCTIATCDVCRKLASDAIKQAREQHPLCLRFFISSNLGPGAVRLRLEEVLSIGSPPTNMVRTCTQAHNKYLMFIDLCHYVS